MVTATARLHTTTPAPTGPQGQWASGQDGQVHGQLTTVEGWRCFVEQKPVVPDLLDQDAWQNLDPQQRLDYDEARLSHHCRLLIVATSMVCRVINEGRRLSYLNRQAVCGRSGLILSGPARTGKTTALTQMAKTLDVVHRRRRPDSPAISRSSTSPPHPPRPPG
jgi:hypothetical protein